MSLLCDFSPGEISGSNVFRIMEYLRQWFLTGMPQELPRVTPQVETASQPWFLGSMQGPAEKKLEQCLLRYTGRHTTTALAAACFSAYTKPERTKAEAVCLPV